MLKFKYAEKHIVPYQVVELGRGVSADGVECFVSARAAFKDTEIERLDKECKLLYGMPFDRVRNIWCGRLNRADLDVWYVIVMDKV